jgi:hypothetical protein
MPYVRVKFMKDKKPLSSDQARTRKRDFGS